MKNFKLFAVVNLILELVAFPLILTFCNEPLLIVLSALYSASAIALISFAFNKKYSESGKWKKPAICICITLLIALVTGVIVFCLQT